MNFSDKIKKIRINNKLTQDQMADKLYVTRQAISNWENDKNLPDIEMIINICKTFNTTLDNLIMEGDSMNNISKKLIDDTSENKKTKNNMICFIIGFAMLIMGTIFLFIKSYSVEYIDAEGILHENFFLIPIAFLFILIGFAIFLIVGIKNVVHYIRNNSNITNKNKMYILFSLTIIFFISGLFELLIYSNSGANILWFAISSIIISILLFIFTIICLFIKR